MWVHSQMYKCKGHLDKEGVIIHMVGAIRKEDISGLSDQFIYFHKVTKENDKSPLTKTERNPTKIVRIRFLDIWLHSSSVKTRHC